MSTIEVDFDVFKALTSRRPTESTTYNDVLREVLGLQRSPLPQGSVVPRGSAWEVKGKSFPAGTEFRAKHKGKEYAGRVEGGALVVQGKRFDSPSPAAMAITGTSVNGWRFWECKRPGDATWRLMTAI